MDIKLKPKLIPIKTGGKYVAVLHEDTAQQLDLHVGDRIKLKSDRTEIIAMLDITANTFPKKSIGLFKEAFTDLNLEKTDTVSIKTTGKPASIVFIRKKLDGARLSAEEINSIVKDIVRNELTDIEMTYFVSGCYAHGLDDVETAALTNAIVNNGKKIKFKKNAIIADKHCVGGVAGNRVTPILVPLVAAAGITMPKTSSRAITSAAGTADAIETVANVTINASRLKTIADTVGGFMVWGGGVDLAAADDRMIRVRNPMSLDPEGMLLASIMAKKHSVSANHVLIDIPVGPGAKIKDAKSAKHLKNRFFKIGKMLGIKVAVIITDGSQPIGNGIGPLLEMIDVMNVLKNDPKAPKDLRDKSILEAGILFELTGKAKKGAGKKMATELLKSGKAWKKFNEIVDAQGRKRIPRRSEHTADFISKKFGKVVAINNKTINHIARIAGAPKDVAAGLFLYKKLGDTVAKGDALFKIYASSPERLAYALEACAAATGYEMR